MAQCSVSLIHKPDSAIMNHHISVSRLPHSEVETWRFTSPCSSPSSAPLWPKLKPRPPLLIVRNLLALGMALRSGPIACAYPVWGHSRMCPGSENWCELISCICSGNRIKRAGTSKWDSVLETALGIYHPPSNGKATFPHETPLIKWNS